MIWSTPSSRKAQVVARSAVEAGIGRYWRDMVVEMIGRRVNTVSSTYLYPQWLLCASLYSKDIFPGSAFDSA